MANEITGGDVGDTEKSGEASGVGSFADPRAAQKNPLDISAFPRSWNYRGTGRSSG